MTRRFLAIALAWGLLSGLGCSGPEWRDREPPPCGNAGNPPPCDGTIVPTGRPPACYACVRGCPRRLGAHALHRRGCGDQEGLACAGESGFETHRCVCGADERWRCTVERALEPTALYVDGRRYAPGEPEHGGAWPELEGVEVDWETEVAAVVGAGSPIEDRAMSRHDENVRVSNGVFYVLDLACPADGTLVLRFPKAQTTPSEVRVQCEP